MLNKYYVTLKSGVVSEVTREETEGKNIIGLWVWSIKRFRQDVLLDFNEQVIRAEDVSGISQPELIDENTQDEPSISLCSEHEDSKGKTFLFKIRKGN